jgi:hypothetical protein
MTAAAHTAPAGRAGLRSERPRFRLSRFTVGALALLFALGIAKGAVEYAGRSAVVQAHTAGTNAILIHVLLAVAVAAVVLVIQVRRARRPGERGPSPWAAPFSARAAARLGRTLRFGQGPSPKNVARALATTVLVLVVAYVPARMGAQVIGGLDPNNTVNAWGGPTYIGAMLAHYLDALVGFYTACFLLGRLLLPASDLPALVPTAWRRRESRPPAAPPCVRLRHGAQVFLFLPLMRTANRAEPAREPGGQLHRVMLDASVAHSRDPPGGEVEPRVRSGE